VTDHTRIFRPLLKDGEKSNNRGKCKVKLLGRAIAQAISCRLPTAAARVRSCGICGEQSGAGASILRVLRFPLPFAPQSPASIIWGWYNRPVVAAVPSGLRLTPLGKIIKEVKLFLYLINYAPRHKIVQRSGGI
jgi:hypothetical protein